MHPRREPGLGVRINLDLVRKLTVPLTIDSGVAHERPRAPPSRPVHTHIGICTCTRISYVLLLDEMCLEPKIVYFFGTHLNGGPRMGTTRALYEEVGVLLPRPRRWTVAAACSTARRACLRSSEHAVMTRPSRCLAGASPPSRFPAGGIPSRGSAPSRKPFRTRRGDNVIETVHFKKP